MFWQVKKWLGWLCAACILFAALAISPAQARPADYAARLDRLRAHYVRALDSLRITQVQNPGGLTARQLIRAALFILADGGDPLEAEQLLSLAFSNQIVDVQADNYGWLRWRVNGDPDVEDRNRNQIELSAVGAILLGYRGRLSPQFLADFLPHVRASLDFLRKDNVPVGWTNMYLLKSVNLLLLGKALDDRAAATEGMDQFLIWLDHTRVNGVTEYNSPNYYAVDLDALYLGYQFAQEHQAQFKAALDYFWHDIAANTFDGRLSGAHSRDNDYLYGNGGVDIYTFYEGLTTEPERGFSDFARIPLMLDNPYHPDAEILALSQLPERLILQRWGAEPGQDRTSYITPDFAASSVSASYGQQDKVLSVQVPGGLPAITVVPDVYNAPWGYIFEASPSGAGRSRPQHPISRPAAVQDRGTILAHFSIDRESAAQPGELGTNILLPANADLMVADGQVVMPALPLQLDLNPNSVVAVLEGTSAVAVRFFAAQDCDNAGGRTVLQADAEGLSYGALRLTHYHGCTGEITGDTRFVNVGVLVVAASLPTPDAFTAWVNSVQAVDIQTSQQEAVFTASALVGDTSLALIRDTENGMVLARAVNGLAPVFPPLAINGVEYTLPVAIAFPLSGRRQVQREARALAQYSTA